MGTKNNPGKFDCLAAAHPDEPTFVLLGRDRDAPALVRRWANVRAARGEDPEKVAEARDCAARMVGWLGLLGREPFHILPETETEELERLRTTTLPMSRATTDVLAERRRQIEAEAFTAEHDDAINSDGQLAFAAACYAIPAPRRGGRGHGYVGLLWPWSWEWWKPKDRRRDLVRAAALLLAEIERLDRS